MKWLIIFSFTIQNILVGNIAFALVQVNSTVETQRKNAFKQESQEIYRSLNISNIVPFEAFFKGYVGYFKYRKRLNSLPIITFLNYSIPSNQPRMVTIDFRARSVLFVSHAAHGRNSSSEGGGVCSKTESVEAFGKQIPACQEIRGVPAVAFSDSGGSLQSSLGFIMAAEHNMGEVVGKSLRLKGLEEHNSRIYNRSILFHDGSYVESGGNSWGCIAVPPSKFEQGYQLLRNNTLIYAFDNQSNALGSMSIPQNTTYRESNIPKAIPVTEVVEEEIPRAEVVEEKIPRAEVVEENISNSVSVAEVVPEEDLSEAVKSESEDPNFGQTPDVSNVKPEKPRFEDLEISKAKPSLGAIALGIAAIGGAIYLVKSNDNKKETNSSDSSDSLRGSVKYQQCQNLSDSSWGDTVEHIKKGGNPSDRFRGSWRELHQSVINESLDNGDAVKKAEERVATINDCVATAHISDRTNFKKPNINQPETKSSKDGSVTCVYKGPESQDYQACLDTIATQDKLLAQEASAHSSQEESFKKSSEERVNQVGGENAQAEALKQFSGLSADHSKIAFERAEISAQKIDQLASVASRIPTVDSLYDECKEKFARHGTVSINEYNQFAKIYLINPKPFAAERDYCLQAVTNGTEPIHNQNAREQLKNVLKKFGHEMEEYTSKSGALKNRAALAPKMDDSGFASRLTDLNFTSGGPGTPMRGGMYGNGPLLLNDSGTNSNGNSNGMSGSGNLNGGVSGSLANANSNSSTKRSNLVEFENSFGNRAPANEENSGHQSGIYDEEFDRKISMALKNPERLAEFNLNSAEMKEYESRKQYNELMANGSKAASSGIERSPALAGKDSISNTEAIKDERPVDISAKEMNLFEIISSRYTKNYYELAPN